MPPSAPEQAQAHARSTRAFVLTLRPAWRAQITGFCLLGLGALLVIAPTWPIAVFSRDAVHALNERMPQVWDGVALVVFARVSLGAVITLWRRYYQKSVVTDRGVLQSVGIIWHLHVSQIEMRNIHVVEVKQPNLVYMVLNLGTVELSTPGSAGADVAIVDVVAPKKLAEFIRYRKDLAQSVQPPRTR